MAWFIAPYRQLTIWVILSAMPGMSGALTLKGLQPAGPNVGKKHDIVTSEKVSDTHFTGKKVSENVRVYAPASSAAVGSLILLMGYGADLSWTLTQWWYLHPAWKASDQEWCKPDCVFSAQDKAAAAHITNNLRIVDAVGNILLAEHSHAWYQYAHWPDGPPIANELEGAIASVFQLIEREYAIVGDYKRIAIAGLSQGADLALEVGLRFPHQLGVVISQQGVLSEARRAGNQTYAAQWTRTPFVLTAGDADELSSPEVYKGTCASLSALQGPIYLKLYPGVSHGKFWKPEWQLAISLFSTMLNPNPKEPQINHLETWTPCV